MTEYNTATTLSPTDAAYIANPGSTLHSTKTRTYNVIIYRS